MLANEKKERAAGDNKSTLLRTNDNKNNPQRGDGLEFDIQC